MQRDEVCCDGFARDISWMNGPCLRRFEDERERAVRGESISAAGQTEGGG